MTWRYLPLLFAALLVAGCGNKAVQNEAAVRQGVIDYLSQRSDLNLTSMRVEVTSVSFRQNEADATVAFRPKDGGGDAGMQMRYTLERKGNRWVVKGRGQSQAGQAPHGAGGMQGGMPGSASPHPPASGGATGGSDLPPGHPPVSRPPGNGK